MEDSTVVCVDFVHDVDVTEIVTEPNNIPTLAYIYFSVIYYYGFQHFLEKVVPMINFKDVEQADAVDIAVSMRSNDARDYDQTLRRFSVGRVCSMLIEDLKRDEGFTQYEALEILADEDYQIPIDIALMYSTDAGDFEIEHLSKLIRNRATRLLKKY